MMSASLYSSVLVMLMPKSAVSACQSFPFMYDIICSRSNALGIFVPTWATVTEEDNLSRTSIFAFTPLLFRASISRKAAIAPPPAMSLVLTNRTFICMPSFPSI